MIPTALRAQPSRKNEIRDYFYGMSFYFYFYYCCLLLFFFWFIYCCLDYLCCYFGYFLLLLSRIFFFFFKGLRIIFGRLRIFLLNLNS